MGNPLDTVLAEYRVALDDAERLAAEAEHLEHLRKVVIAEESDQTLPEWKADALARATQRYKGHLEQLHAVKLAAGAVKAKVTHIATRLDVWRTRESSRRARLQHGD